MLLMTSKKQRKRKEMPNDDIDLITGMQETGLDRDEAIIYLSLLKSGRETGASKIALATGIHRQYVYVTLDKLINTGLVLPVQIGARNKYKAVPPGAVERLARKKFELASAVAQQLAAVSALGNEQDFEIYMGDKQVKDYEFGFVENLEDDESQYVISGGSQNFLSYFGDEYDILARGYTQKHLHTFYIGGVHEMESLAHVKKLNPYFEYRLLKGIPNGVTSTVVRHNSVVVYSLAKPPLIYEIHSKKISDEYKAYFDVMWNIAKPVS
jgi:hypothetical protein